jgi:hypothetical protein
VKGAATLLQPVVEQAGMNFRNQSVSTRGQSPALLPWFAFCFCVGGAGIYACGQAAEESGFSR